MVVVTSYFVAAVVFLLRSNCLITLMDSLKSLRRLRWFSWAVNLSTIAPMFRSYLELIAS